LSERIKNSVGSLIALYFFISGIILIKSSAVIMGESLAEKIVLLIKDTTSGVFAGWIATALLHSSGAFDSIVVAFTSSGAMPLSLAVATIIGAEMGTSVTPFLISVLSRMRKGTRLMASFNVTMSHVLYNLFTLLIFYPMEQLFGTFTNIAWRGSYIFVRAAWLRAIPDLLEVITPWVDPLLLNIPTWTGILLGGGMLVAALWGIEKFMTAIFSLPRSWNLIKATFTKPLRAFVAGFLFTVLVPSTTVMVSLLVPLAGSGVILADYYILPYILGANIGTVFDVMIAALATGDPISLGVWLVHLSINLIGALIFFPLLKPFSRLVRWTAGKIADSPLLTLVIAVIFHAVPILIVASYIF
jgi:sodium-dependent phosphate cotransporter